VRRLLLFGALLAALGGAALWHGSRFGFSGLRVPVAPSSTGFAAAGAEDELLLALGGGPPLRLAPSELRTGPVPLKAGPAGSNLASSAPGSPSPAAAGEAQIIVRRGDTLSKIVRDHYGSARPAAIDAVCRRNRLASPDRLKEGALLVLPPAPLEAAR
jgi:hypothetical protein